MASRRPDLSARPPSSRGTASPTPSDTSSRPARPPKSARRRRPKSGVAGDPTSSAMDRSITTSSSGAETFASSTTTGSRSETESEEMLRRERDRMERELGLRQAMDKLEGTTTRILASSPDLGGSSDTSGARRQSKDRTSMPNHLRELAKGKRRRSKAGSRDLWASRGSQGSIASLSSVMTAGGDSVYEDAMEDLEEEDEGAAGLHQSGRRRSHASLRSKKSKASITAPEEAQPPPTFPPASTSSFSNPFSSSAIPVPSNNVPLQSPTALHAQELTPEAGPSSTRSAFPETPSTVIPLRRYSAIPSARPVPSIINRRNSTQSHSLGGGPDPPRVWHPKPLVLTPARTAALPLTASTSPTSPRGSISPGPGRRSSSALGNYAAPASRRSSMNVSASRESISGRSSPFGPSRRRSMGYVEPGAATARNRDSVTSSVGYSYRSQGLGRKRSESEDTGLTRMSGESPDSSLSGWSEGERGSTDGSPKEREWEDRRRSMRPSSLEAVLESSPLEHEQAEKENLVDDFHVQAIDHTGVDHNKVWVKKDSPSTLSERAPPPRLVSSPPDHSAADAFEPPSPPPTFPLPGIPKGQEDQPLLLHPHSHVGAEAATYSEDNESGGWTSHEERHGSIVSTSTTASTDNEEWHSNPASSPPLITDEMTSNGAAGALVLAGANAQARRSSLSPRTPAFASAHSTPRDPPLPVFQTPLITPPTPATIHSKQYEETPPAVPALPPSLASSPVSSPVSNKSPIIIKGRNKSEGAMRKRPSRNSAVIRRSVSGGDMAAPLRDATPSTPMTPVTSRASASQVTPVAPQGPLSGLAIWPPEEETPRRTFESSAPPIHDSRHNVVFANPTFGAPFQMKPRMGDVSSPQGTKRRPISQSDGSRLEARDPRTQIDRPDPIMRDLLNSTPPFPRGGRSEYSDDEDGKPGSSITPTVSTSNSSSPKKGGFKSRLLSSFRNGGKGTPKSENPRPRMRPISPNTDSRPSSRSSRTTSQASHASLEHSMPMFSPPPPLAVFSLVEEGYLQDDSEQERNPRHSTSSSVSERRAPPRPFQLPPGLAAGMQLPPGLSDHQESLQPTSTSRVRITALPSPSISSHSSSYQSATQRSHAYPSPTSSTFSVPQRNSSMPSQQQQHGARSQHSPGQEYLNLSGGSGSSASRRDVSPRGGRARSTFPAGNPPVEPRSKTRPNQPTRPSYGSHPSHSSSSIQSARSSGARPIPMDMMSHNGQMAVREVFRSQFLER